MPNPARLLALLVLTACGGAADAPSSDDDPSLLQASDDSPETEQPSAKPVRQSKPLALPPEPAPEYRSCDVDDDCAQRASVCRSLDGAAGGPLFCRRELRALGDECEDRDLCEPGLFCERSADRTDAREYCALATRCPTCEMESQLPLSCDGAPHTLDARCETE